MARAAAILFRIVSFSAPALQFCIIGKSPFYAGGFRLFIVRVRGPELALEYRGRLLLKA
jgi:hypothetical protein